MALTGRKFLTRRDGRADELLFRRAAGVHDGANFVIDALFLTHILAAGTFAPRLPMFFNDLDCSRCFDEGDDGLLKIFFRLAHDGALSFDFTVQVLLLFFQARAVSAVLHHFIGLDSVLRLFHHTQSRPHLLGPAFCNRLLSACQFGLRCGELCAAHGDMARRLLLRAITHIEHRL